MHQISNAYKVKTTSNSNKHTQKNNMLKENNSWNEKTRYGTIKIKKKKMENLMTMLKSLYILKDVWCKWIRSFIFVFLFQKSFSSKSLFASLLYMETLKTTILTFMIVINVNVILDDIHYAHCKRSIVSLCFIFAMIFDPWQCMYGILFDVNAFDDSFDVYFHSFFFFVTKSYDYYTYEFV